MFYIVGNLALKGQNKFFYFVTLFFIILIIFLLLRSRFFIAKVVGESMSPTFKIGDLILIFHPPSINWIKRGQVVVFRNLSDATGSNPSPSIKRIIGLPGDIVEPHRGYVTKNDIEPISVPDGFFFLRGDKIMAGNDSFTFGAIPQDTVLGIGLIKLGHSKLLKLDRG